MRVFVAIELSFAARRSLAALQDRLRDSCKGVRWVQPERLHLTVKFLGDVSEARVATIGESLKEAVAECGPFDFVVGGCGCFPPQGPVRVVWAGVEEPTGALSSCAEMVEASLERAGCPRERRPFSPHITLGRVREDPSSGRIRSTIDRADFPAVGHSVDSIVVMSSVLSREGPVYSVVSRAKLACGE